MNKPSSVAEQEAMKAIEREKQTKKADFIASFSSIEEESMVYPSSLPVELDIFDEYVLPQAAKRKLMKSTNTMWRNGKKILRKKYDECDTDDERKKNCLKKTKPEDWV
ncbi:hypothetical protein GIB67_029526 [Kingdonia uniflora]|uniref:Uncharacterized protein n=1 Tax=Kingdonia uniflora TaxID=39325 RepID=A0A7J7NYV4_9MAGN|nr:hypothetical protein GIB67_029526 [Kingdonia uniflora]